MTDMEHNFKLLSKWNKDEKRGLHVPTIQQVELPIVSLQHELLICSKYSPQVERSLITTTDHNHLLNYLLEIVLIEQPLQAKALLTSVRCSQVPSVYIRANTNWQLGMWYIWKPCKLDVIVMSLNNVISCLWWYIGMQTGSIRGGRKLAISFG